MEVKCIADDQERQTDPALTLVPGRVQALFISVLLSKDEYDIINKIFPSASILMNLFCIYNKKHLSSNS